MNTPAPLIADGLKAHNCLWCLEPFGIRDSMTQLHRAFSLPSPEDKKYQASGYCGKACYDTAQQTWADMVSAEQAEQEQEGQDALDTYLEQVWDDESQ